MSRKITSILLKSLPDNPGVYKFYDSTNKLIYVGKAKSLKKRVGSYFTRSTVTNRKTQRLVHEVNFLEYTLTNSEFDALLLENNLIKENQPKYNIQLRDDKSFPFICILNERFPRIISTRRFNKDDGQYFGPFSSVVAMNNVLELIRKLYSIRTCKYNLSEANIKSGKFKVCLEYHIGNCKGPCEGLQTEEEYNNDIKLAADILNGNIGVVKKSFKNEMSKASSNLQFEKAEKFKNKLALLEKFQSKTVVVSKKIKNAEVFSLIEEDNYAYVNYLKISHSAIIRSKSIQIKKKLNESAGEVLSHAILSFHNELGSTTSEIYTNLPIVKISDNIKNIIPMRGEKRKLIELSLKNAFQYKRAKQKSRLKANDVVSDILLKLKEDLGIKKIPYRIECFDNSNLMGSNPVASMVHFKNAKPLKSEYRKFNIKTVSGIDDFASMQEVVFRRYKRILSEKSILPDLIIIDGGKGQLSAVTQALVRLELYGNVPVIGIAKRLEEIYFPNDDLPLYINKASSSLKLIQQIRNEAHRFAITFHRDKRSKAINTELEKINGIGKRTSEKLLKEFKSVKKIKEAPFNEIKSVIGNSRAKIIADYFN